MKRIDEMKAIFHGSFQRAGAERVPVDSERIVCISAGTKRRLLLGPNGVRILALGGIPGKAYERPEPFKLGALDPTVSS